MQRIVIERKEYTVSAQEENIYDTTGDLVTITVGEWNITIPYDVLKSLIKDLQSLQERW